MKENVNIRKRIFLACLIVVGALLTACTQSPVSSSSPNAIPSSVQNSISKTSSNVGSTDEEIISSCISYFESVNMGAWITDPFSSMQNFLNHSNGKFELQVVTYNKLMQMDQSLNQETLYTEQGIAYYPLEICNDLTVQMYGFELDWNDSSVRLPAGMACMPYGYGATMVDANVLSTESFVTNNSIFLTTEKLWLEYGEAPEVIGQLVYQFEYHPENELCPYKLIALTAKN